MKTDNGGLKWHSSLLVFIWPPGLLKSAKKQIKGGMPYSNPYGQVCRVRFLSSKGCAWPWWTNPTAGHSHKAKASSDQRSGIRRYLPTAGHSQISRSFFRSTDPEFDKEKWTLTEKLWSLRATSLTWSLVGDLPRLGQKTGESYTILKGLYYRNMRTDINIRYRSMVVRNPWKW